MVVSINLQKGAFSKECLQSNQHALHVMEDVKSAKSTGLARTLLAYGYFSWTSRSTKSTSIGNRLPRGFGSYFVCCVKCRILYTTVEKYRVRSTVEDFTHHSSSYLPTPIIIPLHLQLTVYQKTLFIPVVEPLSLSIVEPCPLYF